MNSENIESKKMFDFLILTVGHFFFQIISFIRWYLLINYLDIDNYGYYSLVTRFSLILTPLVSLGLGNALLIYIPKLNSEKINNWFYEKRIFIILGISIFLFIFLSYIIYYTTGDFLENYIFRFFSIIIFLVVTLVLNNFIYLYFIAHSKIKFAAVFFFLQSLISIIVVIINIHFLNSLNEILWGINLGQSLVVIVGLLKIFELLIRDNYSNLEKRPEKKFLLKTLINFNIFWIIFNLCYMVFKNIEPILIYDLLGLESSSIYSYILTLCSISSLGFIAINQFLISRFSIQNFNLDKDKKKHEFTVEFQSAFHFSTWVAILITLCLHNIIGFFPSVIQFSKFQGNLFFLYGIILSEIIFGFSLFNIALLSAKEEMIKNVISISIVSLILVILNLFITPIFGIYGAVFIKIFIGVILCIITSYLLHDYLEFGEIIRSSKILFFLFALSVIISFFEFNFLILIFLDILYSILLIRDKMIRNFFNKFLTKINL